MNNYQFYNLISKEKFNSLNTKEKECFLLENKIFVENDWDCTEAQIKISIENDGTDFYARHHMNDVIKFEVVDEYLEQTSIYWDIGVLIKKISFDLENAYDYNTKIEILKKNHHYYLNEIKNDPLIEWYFFKSNRDFYESTFIELSLVETEDITFYMDFVFGEHISFHSNSLFKDWSNLVKNDKILKAIKDALIPILKNKNETVKTESEENQYLLSTSFNDEVFRTIKAQHWFNETLKNMGALEEDKKPKKRKFQPICHAIFYSPDCKKKIFRYSLELKDFILFLNKEFNANIKTKLSNGYLHEAAVEELFLNLI